MKVKFIFLALIVLFFTACEDVKSVEYYKQNMSVADARIKECKSKNILSQDCINAMSAKRISGGKKKGGDVPENIIPNLAPQL